MVGPLLEKASGLAVQTPEQSKALIHAFFVL